MMQVYHCREWEKAYYVENLETGDQWVVPNHARGWGERFRYPDLTGWPEITEALSPGVACVLLTHLGAPVDHAPTQSDYQEATRLVRARIAQIERGIMDAARRRSQKPDAYQRGRTEVQEPKYKTVEAIQARIRELSGGAV